MDGPQPLLTPLITEDCPSLFDEDTKTTLLADEGRYQRSEIDDRWPPWLRRDYRRFLNRYLEAHGVSQRRLAGTVGRSVGFISGFLSPKFSGERFRYHTLHGADLEVLIEHLQLPDNEATLLRDLVYLEDARRRETGQEDFFKRKVDLAWKWETSHLAQDEILKYSRDFRNVILREMVRLQGFRPDPAWMRQHMAFPFTTPVTEDEVSRAWAEVKALKLVEEVDGRWQPAREYLEAFLLTGPKVLRDALTRYYQSTIEAAKGGLALDRERRFYQARTLSMRRSSMETIERRTVDLFSALEEAEPGEGEIVVHIQLAAFTVADINGRPPELPPLEPPLSRSMS